MKRLLITVIALLVLVLAASMASAATIDLFDWAFNVDRTKYEFTKGDSMPVNGTLTNGLGTLTWATNVAGSHTIIGFFDHEIDELINTYYNEYGSTGGSPLAGQSWEIDEPGYSFGNIYVNVLAGSLDNSNGVPSTSPDDVSMAMGWNFSLLSGQTATLSYFLSGTAPLSGFYLAQTDPDSNASIYFTSSINIQGGGPQPVPEPSTLLMLGTALSGIFFFRKRIMK